MHHYSATTEVYIRACIAADEADPRRKLKREEWAEKMMEVISAAAQSKTPTPKKSNHGEKSGKKAKG